MSIRVTCLECDAVNTVDDDQGGKKVRCRKCESLIKVPAKSREAARDDDEDDDRDRDRDRDRDEAPRKKGAAAAKDKPKKRRRDDDYDDEDEPRDRKGKNKKKQGSSVGLLLGIGAVVAVLVIGGGGLAAYYLLGDNDDDNAPVVKPAPSSAVGGPQVAVNAPKTGTTAPPVTPPTTGTTGTTGTTAPPVTPPNTTTSKAGSTATPVAPPPPPPVEPKKNETPVAPPPPPSGAPAVSRNTVYQYVLKSVAWIITKQADGAAMGTGSLIDRDNRLVLTNYHVVHGNLDFVVFFPHYKDGRLISERKVYLAEARSDDAIKGKVIAHDRVRDLALIQLNRVPEGIEALPFAKTEPGTGEDLHSVGNPGGSDNLWVYTPGQVRSIGVKEWKAGGHGLVLDLRARVVESTSPTNPGDSGGPCVNSRGELVGVTQGGSSTANSISIFIAGSEAQDFITQAFAKTDELKGKSWVRAVRPPLDPGSGQVAQLPALLVKLNSNNPQARADGAYQLGLLGPDARLALVDLVKALDDKDSVVKRFASDALKHIGSPTAEIVPDLVPLLKSPNPEVKTYVLSALALLGGDAEAGTDVLEATSDDNPKVRVEAMRALGKMSGTLGKDARTALEKGLGDGDKKVRAAAAESLTTGVAEVKTNVVELQKLLNRKEPEVRTPAARALGQLGEAGKPATKDLIAALGEKDAALRRSAFLALRAMKVDPKEIMPQLRQALRDSDVEVRRSVLDAAGRAGPAAKEFVPAIIDCLADADVREAALSALKQLGPDARDAAGPVANLLEADKTLRPDAIATLDAMKINDKTAEIVAPKLIAAFDGEKQQAIRDRLADTLGRMGRSALVPLSSALRNPSPDVRRGAATALGAMGRPAQAVIREVALAAQAETDKAAQDEEYTALKRIQAAK